MKFLNKRPGRLFRHLRYIFETDTLRYIENYLINRKKTISGNKKIRGLERIATEVLQGPILGPLLFNIF